MIAFANADGGQLVISIENEKQKGNIIVGFKAGRVHFIDDFKWFDCEMSDTSLVLSLEEIPVVNCREKMI